MSVIADAEFTPSQDESANPPESRPPRLEEQYRLERLSWFGLVGVLVVAGIAPDWLSLHNGVAPLAAGLVLSATALLELRRAGTKSLTRWVAGIVLLLIAGFNIFSRPELDLSLLVVVVALIVIGSGIFVRDRSQVPHGAG